MKSLGLNPGEQEMIDMTNEVNINGLIYYPDFCKLVLRKYREENKEVFNQALFKVCVPLYFFTNRRFLAFIFQRNIFKGQQ